MAIHEELNPDDAALPFLTARGMRMLATDNAARTAGVIVVPNRDGTDTVLGTNGLAPWVGDTTPPGRPLDIEATSHLGTALIRWGGELEGGIPSDFRCVQVWAKQVGATAAEKTLVGVLSSAGEVNTGVFAAGTTLDVWATALDNAHDRDGSPAYNESVESMHVQVEILPIVSQQEFDEAADNILAAADESVKAQIERVDTDLAATNEAIDRKAGETLAAANAAAEANLNRVQEEIAGEGGKIDQAANSAYERAKEYTDALKTSVDDDLESITHKINTTAEDMLFAAKQDTAQHIAQVNKDIEAASKKIDETAEKTLADANAAAQAKVDAVNTKVDAAQAKADANAAAIVQTNKTVEANKKAADAAQAQLNKTLTEHGSVLDAVDKDITQAKKDILANSAKADNADAKAESAQQTASAANNTASSAASTASDAIGVANNTAELVKQYGDRSVVSSVVEYAVCGSATVPPEECVTWWEGEPNNSVSVLALCWTTEMPEHKDGEFTWMRTRLKYGDGSESVSAPALITGDKGAQGVPGVAGGQGVSVTMVTNFYALALSEPAQPVNKAPGGVWTTVEPEYDRAKQLYMCSRVDYSNGTWSYTKVTVSSAYKASQAAETAARDAIQTATNAQTTATTAKQTADASKSESADAKSIATGANATATQANATATAANQAATSAVTAANTAKQDAAEAAGIANGKADVLIQSSAPVAAMRKVTTLWIDTTNGANTPKRWNGSAWVAVTDKQAVDAANAATAAQTTADNAQTTATRAETLAANADAKAVAATAAANNAQTTADSKNTVYMQATDPHDEADKAALIVPGDLWWQTSTKAPETYWIGEANNSVSVLVDHSGEIEHMWVWNGSRWNSHVLYAQDMLVNGSIVAELLAVDCVEARHIKVGAIEADKLAATALYGKVIKGGTFLTANERLIIDDAGLLLKDAGGNATITMLAGDGSATFRDVLIVGGTLTTPTLTSGEITGGTISGATVTGGTVQTVTDAHKGIKLTGGNLDIYRSDQKRFLRANESGLYINDGSKDVMAFFNDAGTWKLKLTGPVTSGGEISGATVTGGTVQTSAQADTGIKLVSGNLDIYRSDQSLFMRANESGLLLKDGERTVLGFSRVLRTYWEGEPNNSVSVLSDGWQLTLDGAIQSGGEITGAVITGGTVQTNAAPNKGLKLKDNNLDAYMASGTRFLRLNEAGLWFNDGSADVLSFTQSNGAWKLRLTGAVQAGGAISGATVTGSTVQTTASANRGVKLYSGDATTGNLDVYRADGKLFFQVNEDGLRVKDGDTNLLSFAKVNNAWKLSLKGAIQSGGEISGAAITGAAIRTNTEWQSSEAAKKYRGLVVTDGGMFAYKGNGKEEYSMAFTAATGELKLDGAISTNAVFNAPTISAGQMVGTNIYTSTNADNRVSITSAGLTVTHGGQTVISFAADGAVDLGTSGIAADSRVSDLTAEVHDSYTPLNVFEQTTDALGESVMDVQTQVGATADRLDEEIDARKQYMRFDPNNGLTIGDLTNTDAYSVQLTSTMMQFRAGSSVAAYVSNDRLYINNADILSTLRIGRFAWIPRANGHMSLQYVGDMGVTATPTEEEANTDGAQ